MAFAGDEAANYQPCLDYWKVGMSDKCEPPKKEDKKKQGAVTPTAVIAAVTPTAPVSPTKSKEDEAIDKFLDQYGKPPREFVSFYLNPTPENAMKWAHTYQETLDRNTQLAIAWTQAETLYQKAVQQGVPASKFSSTTLAPVPDYGVPLPGFTDNPAFYPGRAAPNAPIVPAALQGQGGGALAQVSALTNPAALNSGLVATPQQIDRTQTGPIELFYYFSAECPYCQKFQPDFAQLLKEQGSKLKTTCVDVTPYAGPGTGPDQSHVAGKLDCAWRTLKPGEEDQFGIQETPTILIRRKPNGPFERVNGYVPIENLKMYLFSTSDGSATPQIIDAPLR